MKQLRSIARRILDGRGFLRDARAFKKFLETVPKSPESATENGRVAVIVVSPWHYTAVPWYSLLLALLYRARSFKVLVVWDDIPFADVSQLEDQNRIIGRLIKRMPQSISVFRLSEMAASPLSAIDQAEIQRLTELNAVSKFRSSILGPESADYQKNTTAAFRSSLAGIKTILASAKPEQIVIPGGIYGNSGIFIWAARQQKIRATTYDSNPGMVWIGVDDVAAHQMDVAKMFQNPTIREKIRPLESFLLEKAKEELNLRIHGKDRYKFQIHPYSNDRIAAYDILMPLNIDWDAAALGKHNYFQNPFEWIVETIRFILEQTEGTIAVRQHPDERHLIYRCHHDLRKELQNRFPDHPRLRFFGSDEKVNTYNLLESCKILLPMTSTLGIEAAALGKQVIVESNAYYSELSFVQKPRTRAEYFATIRRALSEPMAISEAQKRDAFLCYFFAQIANYIWTDITPTNVDFAKWCTKNFQEIEENSVMKAVLCSLMDAEPAILWRTKVIAQEAGRA